MYVYTLVGIRGTMCDSHTKGVPSTLSTCNSRTFEKLTQEHWVYIDTRVI